MGNAIGTYEEVSNTHSICRMNESAIYCIENTINGKSYIGGTDSIKRRFASHKRDLKRGNHRNAHLQNAWNKYGKDAFRFEILEEVPKEKLIEVEQQYLDVVKLMKYRYYNISFSSERPDVWVGRKHRPETIVKFRKPKTEEAKRNMSIASMGKDGELNYQYDHTIRSFKNNRTGETFTGTRCDFYHKYKLSHGKVNSLIYGERKQHKGWKLI
jgi:group I intron endonuclease